MKYALNMKVKVAQADEETYVMLDGQYYVLNEIARMTLQCFAKGATPEEVVEEMMKEFEGVADPNQVKADCEELLGSFLESKMILEVKE